jgi:hypothetical protein
VPREHEAEASSSSLNQDAQNEAAGNSGVGLIILCCLHSVESYLATLFKFSLFFLPRLSLRKLKSLANFGI